MIILWFNTPITEHTLNKLAVSWSDGYKKTDFFEQYEKFLYLPTIWFFNTLSNDNHFYRAYKDYLNYASSPTSQLSYNPLLQFIIYLFSVLSSSAELQSFL